MDIKKFEFLKKLAENRINHIASERGQRPEFVVLTPMDVVDIMSEASCSGHSDEVEAFSDLNTKSCRECYETVVGIFGGMSGIPLYAGMAAKRPVHEMSDIDGLKRKYFSVYGCIMNKKAEAGEFLDEYAEEAVKNFRENSINWNETEILRSMDDEERLSILTALSNNKSIAGIIDGLIFHWYER